MATWVAIQKVRRSRAFPYLESLVHPLNVPDGKSTDNPVLSLSKGRLSSRQLRLPSAATTSSGRNARPLVDDARSVNARLGGPETGVDHEGASSTPTWRKIDVLGVLNLCRPQRALVLPATPSRIYHHANRGDWICLCRIIRLPEGLNCRLDHAAFGKSRKTEAVCVSTSKIASQRRANSSSSSCLYRRYFLVSISGSLHRMYTSLSHGLSFAVQSDRWPLLWAWLWQVLASRMQAKKRCQQNLIWSPVRPFLL
jgi:hypothetical protein